MAKGTVRVFNDQKGFGFISRDDDGDDVFVHFSNIEGSGRRTLLDGQRVEFEIAAGRKGLEAVRVRVGAAEVSGENMRALTESARSEPPSVREVLDRGDWAPARSSVRQSDASLEVEKFAVFLDTTDPARVLSFMAALGAVFEAYGAVNLSMDPPIWGSFLQRLTLGFKRRKAVKMMFDGMAAQYAGVPQAEADKRGAEAVATLMEQARDPSIPNIVVHARGHVLIKVTQGGGPATLAVMRLTAEQERLLEIDPSWVLDPSVLLQRLEATEASVAAAAALLPGNGGAN